MQKSSVRKVSTREKGPKLAPDLVLNLSRLKILLGKFDTMTACFSTVKPFGDVGAKYVEIIRKSAIVRQREALAAIISLSETGHAAFSACLLRPAYEELLWLEYLRKHSDVAHELLTNMVRQGICESLDAQAEYVGSRAMNDLGFTMRFVKAHHAQQKPLRARMAALGKRMGWREGATGRSVASVAREVGREREYKYLYLATSRFVHFSPHELVRRAWGSPQTVSIGSATFSGYWAAFSLHWGFRIYLHSLLACEELLVESTDDGDAELEK